MPRYIYTTRDKTGQTQKGSLDAINKDEAITMLQAKGLTVTFIKVDEGKSWSLKFLFMRSRMHKRIKLDDLILFGRQLSTLLESGVTLLRSLDIIAKQVESQQLLKVLTDVRKAIQGGEPFSRALRSHPKVFSSFWVNLVETGEASGHLPSSLDQLVKHLESIASLRRKVMAAIYYPAILIGVSVAAILVFLTHVIPVFSKIFEGFNMELPQLTQIVIAISYWLKRYFWVLLIALAAGGYGAFLFLRTAQGRRIKDIALFNAPVIGTIVVQLQASRFASGLGTLIKSGVPILHALEIVGKTSNNALVEDVLNAVKADVRDGKNMATPLEESGVFPVMVTQMVAVGEEIGELGKMLDRISEFYEERLNASVSKLTTLIEPTILILVGTTIGVLVVSMFLPIFKISTIG
ncbi:MAG: type II secretion system F family protein [Candidatus Omnitrophica bacterium]|nr:type II secretion system F family protein [Candidatus Omnitrophota bacterium]